MKATDDAAIVNRCDICEAKVTGCPAYATYCQRIGCGFIRACSDCVKADPGHRGNARRAHEEARHT
jgi:hypothetical protein